MVTIRCTRKAAQSLGLKCFPAASEGTNRLGDWYLNLIPTIGGGMFLFVSSRTLLAVCVPVGQPNIFNLFVRRVANLLAMLDVPRATIEEEIENYRDVVIGKTVSRVVLGSMNDLAYSCQRAFEDLKPGEKVSLSDLELRLSKTPLSALGYKSPAVVGRALVSELSSGHAV